MKPFEQEVSERLAANAVTSGLTSSADAFMRASLGPKYSYNFSWLGRPIIQYPQDIVAMQEIIWRTQPDLIIETGIAHGGSLIFSASMLELNAICGGPSNATVLGIDIEIRAHNRAAIEGHPLARRIQMVEGSSIDRSVVSEVVQRSKTYRKILVCLDSNHTHDHVYAELEAYAPLTTVGSYCVVFDTIVEMTPECCPADRPWGKGNNPMTAVAAFLERHAEFSVDNDMDNKLLISVAPRGYLKRVR